MSQRRYQPARVSALRALGGGYHHLILEAPHLAAGEVGSFALLSVRAVDAAAVDPLLPRPFSFLSRDPGRGEVEIFFKEVGRGTREMARWTPGTRVQTLGPLGHGFRPPGRRRVVLLAGGVGMPPLLDLGTELARDHAVTCYYGGRSEADLHFLERFAAAGIELVTCTDDGSAGVSGTNVDAFRAWLGQGGGEGPAVYACGPTPMMRAAAELCEGAGLPLQFSLEANMACGIGICRGCAVARSEGEGYAMVCQDGPVFFAGEVRP
ncbi:MAG: dihydroorotate dehydrogenase electron transfer subunit [Deltaproteobacteria bacterium]|nr:dihydroorotate dehydrogenase electron transfer subunit [Deltaproteobacteria bacterium]